MFRGSAPRLNIWWQLWCISIVLAHICVAVVHPGSFGSWSVVVVLTHVLLVEVVICGSNSFSVVAYEAVIASI